MKPLLHFSDELTVPSWRVVNDDVMGGRSSSQIELADGLLRFEGQLSLANNGGFASVRTMDQTFDLSQARALILNVRGDGRSYQLRLASSARYRGIPISYGRSFPTEADTWTEVRIPLAEFSPSVRGFALSGPALDPSSIQEIGLLIADKREGRFKLEVASISMEPFDR